MPMFCYQCQEALKNTGCDGAAGACGKTGHISAAMDQLISDVKEMAAAAKAARAVGVRDKEADRLLVDALFTTITNVSFDDLGVAALGDKVRAKARRLAATAGECVTAGPVGVMAEPDADIRSLKELITCGIKGMAAYYYHAAALNYHDQSLVDFMNDTLAELLHRPPLARFLDLAMETGRQAVAVMALLDKANTTTYGNPEITRINIGVRPAPGILISGHDLKDLQQLLEQTAGTGVDVYTHGEMLPAHCYPAFKMFPHLAGNYGNAWWLQPSEFESFNGPIIMTTNCLTPVRTSYARRLFTTGVVACPDVAHIPDNPRGGIKDFSSVISLAKTCPPPQAIETGHIVAGFGHHQILALADKILPAIKSGTIKRFVVMAGCDGRSPARNYYTQVARDLPRDVVILTAGCAKYRYNKLDLGDIGGIPRVLDAGQCNDSYSLALVALKLKEILGLSDINDLPISFDIAWYEQKAVTVLLALLYLGVKNIRLGPTLPAFLSVNVARTLTRQFGLLPIGDPSGDIAAMLN